MQGTHLALIELAATALIVGVWFALDRRNLRRDIAAREAREREARERDTRALAACALAARECDAGADDARGPPTRCAGSPATPPVPHAGRDFSR